MNPEHISAIEQLVADYMESNKLIPNHSTLEVSIKFIPRQIVVAKNHVPDDILNQNCWESFSKFLKGTSYKKFVSIEFLFCKDKEKWKEHDLTIGEFLNLYNSDQVLLSKRHIGQLALKIIDEWLASVGLRRKK